MRKFILAASFCMLAYTMCQTVTLGQPTSPTATEERKPTCFGTKAITIKCPVNMPAGHFESLGCEVDKPGHVGCFHAFAYNQDTFDCSAEEINNTTVPPSYTTLCSDLPYSIVVCYIRKDCVTEFKTKLVNDMVENYTVCTVGEIKINYKYKKSTTKAPECTPYVHN